MNYANEIKAAVSIKTLCESYGLIFNRTGFALCPFHSEKTPSFRVREHTNTYHCFGCGDGGTVIDFVMKAENCDFDTACRSLDAKFGLGFYGHISFAQRRKLEQDALARKKAQAAKAAEKEFSDRQNNILCAYYRWLTEQPQTPAVIFDREYLDRLFYSGAPINFDANVRVNALLEKHPNRGDYDKQHEAGYGIDQN